MRLLHVTESLDPVRGGPPAVVVRLAAAQAAAGHEAHILCHRVDDTDGRVGRFLSVVPGFDRVVRHECDPGRGLLQRATARGARRTLDTIISGFDMVHLHEVWLPIVRVSAAAARRAGVPYLLAPHSTLSPWSLRQKHLKKRIALALGYRTMLDRAAAIHALNQTEAALIGPLALRCPVEILANGIFVQEVEPLPAKGDFRAAHPELGDDPYILFLARLQERKGLDFLAEAFIRMAARQPRARVVVAGPDEGCREDFERRIRGAGLEGRVHLPGPIYGAQKLGALVDAACFCLPSREEGFSIAVLEAMAAGCPMVLSEHCNFPEVAAGKAGHVVPLDADRLAEALAAVLSDPAAAAEMGKRARAMVMADYTWPEIARKSVEIYSRYTRSRGSIG
ncbi:MAG: glycosyltransferase [Phycisphaeraceae bacterium]|nr:glycosyltransferase [Phycisphaeraceae bacterium]